MAHETVLYDLSDGVATVTMNRPDRLNALNPQLLGDLGDALAAAAEDPAARCVILTGAGRGFCAGADLATVGDQSGTAPVDDALRASFHPVIRRIAGMEKPVVAAINGVAAGAGASLAFACDFRIVSEKASFIQAFVRIGLVPDSGSTYFLPRLIGYARALEMSMLGDTVDAERAQQLGLVTRLVPAEELTAAAREFATRLAEGPTFAIGLTRKVMTFGSRTDLESALDFEADAQALVSRSADAVEGITAFIQKRPARFAGR